MTNKKSLSFNKLPPLSLYIHMPWCIRKCPYCDFYSHAISSAVPEERYIKALKKDLVDSFSFIQNRPIETVFIGGGTPSLFSGKAISDLLSFLNQKLTLTSDVEISIEANPGTFDADKIKAYKEAGINRLSLGIQSFQAKNLIALRRIHDEKQAQKAVENALKYFDNVNLDLMYALPNQTLEDLANDLEKAITYHPKHLSLYQLTIELNTSFAENPPTLPEDDVVADMQTHIEKETDKAGYIHYEVSAYAKPQYQCRHNLNYWLFGDYLGIGSGAHAKLSTKDQIIRQVRHDQPPTYMNEAQKGEAIQETRVLTDEDIGFEFMLNALRLPTGFSPDLFQERTGLSLDLLMPYLNKAKQKGLLICEPTNIRPSEKGMLFLNDLQQIFLPD